MKTPMQEMLEYVQEEVQLFGSARQSLINKIKQLLEKEKEVMAGVYAAGGDYDEAPQPRFNNYYNETFNTKER